MTPTEMIINQGARTSEELAIHVKKPLFSGKIAVIGANHTAAEEGNNLTNSTGLISTDDISVLRAQGKIPKLHLELTDFRRGEGITNPGLRGFQVVTNRVENAGLKEILHVSSTETASAYFKPTPEQPFRAFIEISPAYLDRELTDEEWKKLATLSAALNALVRPEELNQENKTLRQR